jgi:hypothetical protein
LGALIASPTAGRSWGGIDAHPSSRGPDGVDARRAGGCIISDVAAPTEWENFFLSRGKVILNRIGEFSDWELTQSTY